MKIDLLIKNGLVVDPCNSINMIADVALAQGKVVAVAPGQDPVTADEVIDATGMIVTPGLVDSHVHLVPEGAGGVAFNMLLRKGVTTAVDFMGGIDVFIEETHAHGHGVNAGCLHALVPGKDLPGTSAGREQVADVVASVVEKGAFGIKILGGHFPFDPQTTGYIIEECAKRKAYVAFHAGTTVNGSNIKGFEEAVTLADGNPLHVAHANAYCRGQITDPLEEVQRMFAGFTTNPNLVSESYLSVMNGTSAEVDPANDTVKSGVTRTWLQKKGYSTDKAGVKKAILDGWCCIYGRVGSEMIYLPPADGLKYWEDRKTESWCSFPVNNPVVMLACATTRRADGSFIINAISTDGGFIPRNVIFENGLHLARMRYMELDDMVAKASYHPARMLGLFTKGHLSTGADADVAVFNACSGKAEYTVIGGVVRMAAGVCAEGPGVIFTSKQGEKALAKTGAAYIVADIEASGYMKGHVKA